MNALDFIAQYDASAIAVEPIPMKLDDEKQRRHYKRAAVVVVALIVERWFQTGVYRTVPLSEDRHEMDARCALLALLKGLAEHTPIRGHTDLIELVKWVIALTEKVATHLGYDSLMLDKVSPEERKKSPYSIDQVEIFPSLASFGIFGSIGGLIELNYRLMVFIKRPPSV